MVIPLGAIEPSVPPTMIPVGRRLGPLRALLLFAVILPFSATPARADVGASVPDGFQDEALFTGLDHPMAVAFAPNGNVFIAEKRGTIVVYSSLSDPTPTVFADLNTNVHNYWDRGLLGLAVDPQFPARPYVYVLYAYNHILGDPAAAPRWPSAADLDPPGSPMDDRCPNPPRANTDGCVISGRLSRLTSSGGVMTGPEHVLIEDWCQQFPSHGVGGLMFGPEGALYVSAGDGASFVGPDYGQHGGSLPGTPTPRNPCGDPPGGPGSVLAPPTAEGGVLRSQDLRTSGDAVTLDGSILRVDPDTGLGWPTNALAGHGDANARRIIGYGLRNPFRFTFRPGTDEVWLGDVGWNDWEEIDRLIDPDAAPRNFGWPCWEGNSPQPTYSALGLDICATLSAADVTAPYHAYHHSAPVAGDGCGTGSSSISGLTFLASSSDYPDSYDDALFMTDYTRRCIWVMRAGPGGLPDIASRALFADLDRPGTSDDGGSVFLSTAPDGDLVYADYDRGEIRRVHYYGVNVPPVARFVAVPATGPAPLAVTFDASGSTDADDDQLTYGWDLDGDGQYDDGTAPTASRTYPIPGNVTVGLRVQDPDGLFDTTSRVVSPGNTAPTVSIVTPAASLTWNVGDTVMFRATASDAQDGTLPPSAYRWTLTMRHCPSDCHAHVIETFDGVASGSFDAPDHDVPAHLLLSVVVTDSNNSTASAQLELYPVLGSVALNASPSGILTSVGDITGEAPAKTAIVGSSVTVGAPISAVIGEETWTFQRWSDGGARIHEVPITEASQLLTAVYAMTSTTDASNTCAGSGAALIPSGRWQAGRFATANDVDWYRFKLTKSTRMRIVLGNLPVTARLELYRGCGTLLQASDRAGTGAEEIIRSLPAGTYTVRLVGVGGPSQLDHALLLKPLPSSAKVLTARARIEGAKLRLVGEVYNNSSRAVGPVTVTARLYNVGGTLLATRSARLDLAYMGAYTRAPFSIVGATPAGYHHAGWSVTAPTTTAKVTNPPRTITTSAPDSAGHWVVAGTVKNVLKTKVRSLAVAVTLYDKWGNVLDVARAKVGSTTLGPGRSTTVNAAFLPTGLSPDRVYVRVMALR